MSGRIRQKIAPVKARLVALCEQAATILEQRQDGIDAAEIQQNVPQLLETLIVRLENQVRILKELDSAWDVYLTNLETENRDPEQTQEELDNQSTWAEGDDGYLVVQANADDTLILLKLKQRRDAAGVRLNHHEAQLENVPQPAPPLVNPAADFVQNVPENVPVNPLADDRVVAVPPPPPRVPEVPGHVKLPRTQLPTFTGNLTEWPAFWAQFRSAVHDQAVLANVQKFVYLRGVLQGKAADVISTLPITEENYQQAVNLLTERFGDRERQIGALENSWFALPNVSMKPTELGNLVDSADKIFRQLKELGNDMDHNSLAIRSFRQKLSQSVILHLENKRNFEYEWSLSRMLDLLKQYIKIQETVGPQMHSSQTQKVFTDSSEKRYELSKSTVQQDFSRNLNLPASSDTLLNKTVARYPCVFCNGKHFPDECSSFKSVSERKLKLTSENRCFLCLKTDHRIGNCPAKGTYFCFYCKKVGNHHRSVCPLKFDPSSIGAHVSAIETEKTLLTRNQYALLLTASVTVRKPHSAKFLDCRLILDSGSQHSYILHSVADALGLPSNGKQELSISTFAADEPKIMDSYLADLEIFFQDGTSKILTVNAIPKLTGEMRRECLCNDDLSVLKSTYANCLADVIPEKPECFQPNILIGVDYYFDFCDDAGARNMKLPSGLRLIPSKLGLLVGGRTSNYCDKNTGMMSSDSVHKGNVLFTSETNLKSKGKNCDVAPNISANDFWSLESIGIKDSTGQPETDSVLRDFETNLSFYENRYHVCWPWKEKEPNLTDNFGLSMGRFRSICKRLNSDTDLLHKYTEIIERQGKLGITENVTDLPTTSNLIHYLPHHPVITPEKTTTKVRIVYDASSKADSCQKSLNECLHSGPNLIPNLCGMLLRFRLPEIAIISDVEKAFLQVGLQMPDRDVTRFFWFKDPSQPWLGRNLENLAIHRFCRIPFGVISSPFLLEAVIKHHVKEIDTPLAAEIEQNLYVDNILMSAKTVEEALLKFKEGKKIFSSMSMNLREWASNDRSFVAQLPDEEKASGDKLKVLGLSWNLANDTITVRIPDMTQNNSPLTKRTLLAMISSVFDPLGLWLPATFFGKVLFQDLWKQKFSWDEILPTQIQEQWKMAVSAMQSIGTTSFPRWVSHTNVNKYRLVVFSDASTKAYGAVIYILVHTSVGIISNFLFSKMRLVPIKSSKLNSDPNMSVPRLELMGVLVGIRMLNFVRQQIHGSLLDAIFWTDSQCVLYWIHSEKTMAPFVHNRVKEIRSCQDVKFQFVPTQQNPADLLTRGMTGNELSLSDFWWHGPQWLQQSENEWPTVPLLTSTEFSDGKPFNSTNLQLSTPTFVATSNFSTTPCDINSSKFSSLRKLLRVTVYCLRFVKMKCPKGINRIRNSEVINKRKEITAKEIVVAKNLWCSYSQKNGYPELFSRIPGQKKKDLAKQLGLFIDQTGLIRCGGRFRNVSRGSPILLPRNSDFTNLIIKEAHTKVLHGGTNCTLAEVRKQYWITQGRVEVSRVLKNCFCCRKYNGGPYKMPDFAPFPANRIEPAPPFKYTGLDYFGPVLVKAEGAPKKQWICLFTCLVVRAVHLELVSDMTTSQFLGAFRRFVSRRGCPARVMSDNARQFKAAEIIIRDSLQQFQSDSEVSAYFSDQNSVWKFIPEFSPWQGGVYERMIGTVKGSLKKSLGRRLLSADQLSTVLCEVEAIVNGRPITYISAEFPDHQALRPSNFLLPCNQPNIVPSFSSNKNDDEYLPSSDLQSTASCIQKLWKRQIQVLDDFWKVWSSEYLNMLRERKDYKHPSGKVSVQCGPATGDVVLVSEIGVPRGRWKLGKIVKINISNDNKIRSVLVQLPSRKIVVRPINHLYPLECLARGVS